MDWRKFIAKLQKLGYDGATDNIDEVTVWLKENGHDSQYVEAKGKKLNLKELFENRPGQTLDMSDAADEAERDAEILQKADELIAERERAGLITRRRGSSETAGHPHQVRVIKERIEDDPCLGYNKFSELGFGQWLKDVAVSAICMKEGRLDDRPARLLKANQIVMKQLGMNEQLDGEGGFLAPTEHRQELLKRMYEVGRVFPRARQVAMSSRSMDIPYIVEISRATGSRHGGVRGYWVAEASTLTASTPSFGLLTLNAHKLACLGYATTEIEEDSAIGALQLLSELFAEELAWLMDESFISGTGAGQPLGILNSSCLISADREDATEIHAVDIIAMWARLWAPSRPNAVWFISQDLMVDLQRLSAETVTATATEIPYFLPQLAGTGMQLNSLFGRPIIEIEQCSVRGDPGDIILADMTQYLHGMRRGIQTAQSIHVQFLTDQTAFKATVRLDGQPWWQAALTPANGGATLSPFITTTTS